MKKLLRAILVLPLYLLANSVQAQCGVDFFDGFESGSYSPTWTLGAGLSAATVNTTNPASGNYKLEATGGTNGHLNGLSTTIPAVTPSSMSWDMYPTGTVAQNYVVLGDASVSAGNCIVFAYWNGSTNKIRFVASITYEHTANANQWYHIELRNINWGSHTYDLYIDNVLVYSSFPFRSSTQNSVSNLHLYNYNSGVGIWDNIQIGSGGVISLGNTSTQPACNGASTGAIDLSVSGGTPGYTYSWSNGATTQDLSGVPAGNYTVTVTDNGGCTEVLSVTLSEPPAFAYSPSVTDASCFGGSDGSIDITPSGGDGSYTYLWSNGAVTQDLSGLAAGSYTLTITDGSSCTGTTSFTVTEPTAIVPNASTTSPLCAGGNDGSITTSPTGGAGNYSYQWSTGDVTSSISSLVAGIYTVTISDLSGCSVIDTIILADPSGMALSASILDPACTGDGNGSIDITVLGGAPGFSFSWNTGDVTEDLSNLSAGNYSVTVTDANGCTTTQTYGVFDPVALTTTATTSSDNGSNTGSVNLTVNGGTPPYSFNWSDGSVTEDITGLAAGGYTVTVTDANGCTTTGTYTVPVGVGIGDAQQIIFKAYPNPFQGNFSVSVQGIGHDAVHIRLQDLQGRTLWAQEILNETVVPVSVDLPAGIYFLSLQSGDETKTIKLRRE